MRLLIQACTLLVWLLLYTLPVFAVAVMQGVNVQDSTENMQSACDNCLLQQQASLSHIDVQVEKNDNFWFSMIKAAIVFFLSGLLLLVSIFTVYIDLLAPLFFNDVDSLTLSLWTYFIQDIFLAWYWLPASIIGRTLGLLLGFSLVVFGYLYAKFWYFG